MGRYRAWGSKRSEEIHWWNKRREGQGATRGSMMKGWASLETEKVKAVLGWGQGVQSPPLNASTLYTFFSPSFLNLCWFLAISSLLHYSVDFFGTCILTLAFSLFISTSAQPVVISFWNLVHPRQLHHTYCTYQQFFSSFSASNLLHIIKLSLPILKQCLSALL